jgi:hypothetical protein
MSIATRLTLYRDIEALRGCPLIAYVTSTRPNAQGGMATDVIPEILDQLLALPSDCKQVDLLVVSLGGDPTVAWRIMTLLRDRVKKVGVLVPQAAFSAATLLALGADEIVMHPCGNLGPVDPQIRVMRKTDGKTSPEVLSFGSEDLAGFLNFVRHNVGLSDQEYLKSAFELFCKEVGAVPIGIASRGARLSLSLGVKLLQMHMRDEAAKQKATAIAETLNKEFFHHGYPVGRKEAKEIGLKVVEPKPELEGKMWALWSDIETDLECRCPFNPMREIEKAGKAGPLFAPIPQLQMPANLPPQVAQQVMNQVLQKIGIVEVEPVEYSTVAALVESSRRASAYTIKGRIFARRDFEAKIGLNTVVTSQQWEPVQMPADAGNTGGGAS